MSAKEIVDRLLAERGPIPHHHLQTIARLLRKTTKDTPGQAKKPA